LVFSIFLDLQGYTQNKPVIKDLKYFLFLVIISFIWSGIPCHSFGQQQMRKRDYVLLYSTPGYELNGTKRALLRTNSHIDSSLIDIKESYWQVIDRNGKMAMKGFLKYLGITWRIQLWEIDFTNIRDSGLYKIKLFLTSKDGNSNFTLSSFDFEIKKHLYVDRTLLGVSIYNAESRKALAHEGGGYYDCNSRMGEARSHGLFLNGLVHAYVREKNRLTGQEQERLITAANIAADYIIRLHNDSTGEILSEYPQRRPGSLPQSPYQSLLALYGLSTYAHYFKNIEPERAQQAFEKAVKTTEYLDNIGKLSIELKIIVNYYFFKFSGKETFKRNAITALRKQLDTYEQYGPGLHDSMDKTYGRTIPCFEGLYLCVREFKDDPDRSFWIEKARILNKQYIQKILNRNGFNVIPLGGKEEWDNMERIPPQRPHGMHLPGYWEESYGSPNDYGSFYPNIGFATWTLDAIFLASVTGDHSLEKIAAASLGWITGLNPGIPGEMAMNPYQERQKLTSAAFIMNLDAVHVKPWTEWWWIPTSSMMSIVNGFVIRNGIFDYYDLGAHFAPETFILTDGIYLYAICLYDQYLYERSILSIKK